MQNAHAPRIARCTGNAPYVSRTILAKARFPAASGSSQAAAAAAIRGYPAVARTSPKQASTFPARAPLASVR